MNINRTPTRRMIEHRWHGMRPVYELQTWSNASQKWITTKSGTLNEVSDFIKEQNWTIPETTIEWHNSLNDC